MWRWWLSFSVVKVLEIAARGSAVRDSYTAHVVELVYWWNLGMLVGLVRAADCSIFGCFRVELGVGGGWVDCCSLFLPSEATARRGDELCTRRAHATQQQRR